MHYNTHSCLLYERYIVPMAHIGAVLFIYSTQDTMRIPIDDWRNTKKRNASLTTRAHNKVES